MKNGWQRKQLGELAELRGRIGWRGLTAKEYTTSGPLFLSVHSLNYGDYVDYRDAFHISEDRYAESPEIMLRKDDILICKDGAGIGKLGIVGDLPSRTTINSSLLLIRSGKDILPKFLYRCLSSPYFQEIVNSRLNGATTPHLYQRDITEFPVISPPLPEQQQIVALLDEAFAALVTAKANTEKNLQNAQAIFESRLQSIFIQRSGEWNRVVPLSSILSAQPRNGWSPPMEFQTGSGIPVLTLSSVTGFQYDGSKIKLSSVPTRPDAHYWLKNGELLITRSNTPQLVGHVAIYDGTPQKAICCDLIMKMTIEQSKADTRFVYYYLRSPEARLYLTSCAQGASSTMKKIGKEVVQNIPVPLPSLTMQKATVEILDSLESETQRLASLYRQKLTALDALKKSLLYQAFTGQLTATEFAIDAPAPIPFPIQLSGISATDAHAGILAMACDLHEANGKFDRFTHVKAEKIAHMVEACVGIDLGRKPVKDAAGPNDFNHLKKVEHRAKFANFFDFKRTPSGAYRVQKLGGFHRIIDKTKTALADKLPEVEKLLRWMLPMTVQQAEIVATVYAAWNNLLLEGKTPSNEEIVYESRENWHPDKLKIDREKFFNAVQWLRDQHVVPSGKGKRVENKAVA